jgi:hypothetical protein
VLCGWLYHDLGEAGRCHIGIKNDPKGGECIPEVRRNVRMGKRRCYRDGVVIARLEALGYPEELSALVLTIGLSG